MNELVSNSPKKQALHQNKPKKQFAVIKEYIQSQLPPMMQGMVDNFLQAGNKQSDDFLG